MKWWGYLILLLVIAGFLTYYLMKFRNKVVNKKEDIEKAKSRVRILKAKYLQVLRKVGTTQKDSNDAQGGAYYAANRNGGGRFIGGAIGAVDSNFEEVGKLVVSLASEYQFAQQNLNELINYYNLYITSFPRLILAKIFGYKKENYIDSGKVMLNTDYKEIIKECDYDLLIYTGPLDYYFDYSLGKLLYRSIEFIFETYKMESYQPIASTRYPGFEEKYTRVTEFKKMTGQISDYTTVLKEIPCFGDEPYYPYPTPKWKEFAERYRILCRNEPKTIFLGRLAEYRYPVSAEIIFLSVSISIMCFHRSE